MFEGSNTFSRTINLNNGVATYDFGSQLHNGTYNLTVTFNGDMNFEKATANGTYDINKLTYFKVSLRKNLNTMNLL